MNGKRRLRLRHRLGTAAIRLVVKVGGRLPPRLARRLSRVVLKVVFPLLRRERRVVRETLSAADAPFRVLDGREFARRVFENFSKSALELVATTEHWPEMLDVLVPPDNLSEFDAALLSHYRRWGRLIVVTCHMGNWEILAGVIARKFPLAVVARKIRSPDFQAMAEDMRGKLGVKVLYQEDPVRKMLRFLKDGGVLGLVPDQDIERMPGVFAPFLGRQAHTPVGPALLAARTGAPILPVFMFHERVGYRLALADPLPPPSRSRESIYEATVAWQKVLEKAVIRHPEQWAWFHRRFRTRPDDVR